MVNLLFFLKDNKVLIFACLFHYFSHETSDNFKLRNRKENFTENKIQNTAMVVYILFSIKFSVFIQQLKVFAYLLSSSFISLFAVLIL